MPKILKPKVQIAESLIIPFHEIAKKKYNVDIPADIIPTYRVTLEISNWLSELTSVISYVLRSMIDTNRIDDVEVVCSDRISLNEHIKTRLRMTKFAHDSPLGPITLEYTHTGESQHPQNISMHKFKSSKKLDKYCEDYNFMVIGPGETVKIAAVITKGNAVDLGIYHNYLTYFSRMGMTETDENGKEFGELDPVEYEYNHGTIELQYQDNRPGEDVLKLALDTIVSYVESIIDRFDELIILTISNIFIKIPDDKSTIMAHLLKRYIYSDLDDGTIIAVSKNDGTRISIKTTDEKILELVKKSFGKLVSDVKSMM